MRKYILIGAGGFAGAVGRYFIRGLMNGIASGYLPVGTLLINAAGAFLLAFVLSEAFEVFNLGADLKLGVTTGLLGALTTFSTLCKESAGLMMAGDTATGAAYLVISVLLGIAAAFCGSSLARSLTIRRSVNRNDSKEIEQIDAESEVD